MRMHVDLSILCIRWAFVFPTFEHFATFSVRRNAFCFHAHRARDAKIERVGRREECLFLQGSNFSSAPIVASFSLVLQSYGSLEPYVLGPRFPTKKYTAFFMKVRMPHESMGRNTESFVARRRDVKLSCCVTLSPCYRTWIHVCFVEALWPYLHRVLGILSTPACNIRSRCHANAWLSHFQKKNCSVIKRIRSQNEVDSVAK